MNHLKKQIKTLRGTLKEKDDINNNLKQNQNCSKYALLESEYIIVLEELSYLKQHNEFLLTSLQE
jgi:hypothetical protein